MHFLGVWGQKTESHKRRDKNKHWGNVIKAGERWIQKYFFFFALRILIYSIVDRDGRKTWQQNNVPQV